jgi:hypothetical protein
MLKNIDSLPLNDLEVAIVDEFINSNKLHRSQTCSKIHILVEN